MDLIELNQRGLIPGPDEEEASFQARAFYNLGLRNTLPTANDGILQEAYPQLKPYDITPDWVPVLFDNTHLSPWHGASAWIFQEEEHLPTGALIQLRKTLSKKKTLLRWYRREDVTTHELCHVARMMFEEPKYEEILAYRSHGNWWGGLVQSSTESMIFVLSLFLLVLVDFVTLNYGSWSLYLRFLPLKIIPLALIAGASVRLFIRQRQVSRCLQNLNQWTPQPEAVLFRLTDREIEQFAKGIDMEAYAKSQHSPRWEVIRSYGEKAAKAASISSSLAASL